MWKEVEIPSGEKTNYGYGWDVRTIEGLKTTNHTGQVAGFNSVFTRFTEEEFAIIVMINRYRVSTEPIAKKVLHTFIPALAASSK